MWALRLKQFKEQNIPLNHLSRTKKQYVPLANPLHNLRNTDDINKIIKILRIPEELIGNKKKYERVPRCNDPKRQGFFCIFHKTIALSINLLLRELKEANLLLPNNPQ
jgi:hypothetical protein